MCIELVLTDTDADGG